MERKAFATRRRLRVFSAGLRPNQGDVLETPVEYRFAGRWSSIVPFCIRPRIDWFHPHRRREASDRRLPTWPTFGGNRPNLLLASAPLSKPHYSKGSPA